MEVHNKRDKRQLIRVIAERNRRTPNFALLIGAGASASSGVKPAKEMIDEWRRQLYEQAGKPKEYENWLKDQDWYDDDEEYSILFEKVRDERAQRRIYIEEWVKDAKPSWGYIYLANIIGAGYFNVVFTTNFDDLLNEAFYVYTNEKPIVCAHDSAVSDIRVTSARPKIIKLHGDFLYDSIRNTINETDRLAENMEEKFKQFGKEYGLVVIGYGGCDNSVMNIIEAMVRSKYYLPHGLYWCLRKGSNPSKRLDRLIRRGYVYLVEIDGFDEFVAELHDALHLDLPLAVRDPFKATTERLDGFVSVKEEMDNPIIRRDIAGLQNQIIRLEKAVSRRSVKGRIR